jgi:hypothetical protein
VDTGFDWTTAEPRTTVVGVFGAAAGKALQLALKPDCAAFLKSIGQQALLMAAGMKPGAPFLPNLGGQFVQSTYDNYSAFGVGLTASSATLVNQAGNDPTSGNYHTAAEISAQNTITTYMTFNNEGLLAKAQTLLHEATHLASGGSDQQVAAAAGVPDAANMSTGQASAAFQKELAKHCK